MPKRQRTSFGPNADQTMSRPNIHKRVHVCLMPIRGFPKHMWYSFRSFSIAGLIGDSSSEDEDEGEKTLERVTFKRDPNLPFGMCFICVGDVLYGVGGLVFDELARPVPCRKASLELNCLSLHDRSVKQKCSMRAGKSGSLVVEIGGFIYVLAGHPFARDPRDITFEVYDPCNDEWTRLKSPPFFGFGARLDFLGYSYVVIDRKLCVSTRYFSCAFDTGTKKWESCELFRDYYNGAGSKNKKCKEKKCLDSWRGKYRPEKGENCGPPFPFLGRAILCDDILLCHVPYFDACVVAYQMVDGKVKRIQHLLENVPSRALQNIVDLGGGYFCCVLCTGEWDDYKADVSFVTFKVSKIGGDGTMGALSDSSFLECGDVRTTTWTLRTKSFCQCAYSFAS